jgi:hypothetical protein
VPAYTPHHTSSKLIYHCVAHPPHRNYPRNPAHIRTCTCCASLGRPPCRRFSFRVNICKQDLPLSAIQLNQPRDVTPSSVCIHYLSPRSSRTALIDGQLTPSANTETTVAITETQVLHISAAEGRASLANHSASLRFTYSGFNEYGLDKCANVMPAVTKDCKCFGSLVRLACHSATTSLGRAEPVTPVLAPSLRVMLVRKGQSARASTLSVAP